jgi:hypothetical protein
MIKRVIAAGTAVSAALALSACGGRTHESSAAGATDFSPAQVLAMPAGFRNVALKCAFLQGTWYAVASTSDGGNGDNLPAGVAITPDPKCQHYGGR